MTTGRAFEESRLSEVGRVVAGQCHELVNVLNIVNEMSGLQEDILPRAREGHAAALDKLGRLAARIQEQVKRGRTIIRDLQQLAHGLDAVRPGDGSPAAGGGDRGGAGGGG